MHIPVLKNEILETFDYLKDKDGFFVDGTLGAGGHSLAIAKNVSCHPRLDLGSRIKIIGVDKDHSALDIAKKNMTEAGLTDKLVLIHDDFKNIDEILKPFGLAQDGQVQDDKISDGKDHTDFKINGALIDLGVSSMQLDDKTRGFSFSDPNQKLDMRMDQNQGLDAQAIINTYNESKLTSIISDFGEERFAKNIARLICLQRKNAPIETVEDLIKILEKAIPVGVRKKSKTHFATKTFQAIRIEVNNELNDLEKTLNKFVDALEPGARLAVITFHSLEDRIVKNTFRQLSKECICPTSAPICICNNKPSVKMITRKPIIASDEEIKINPRSRSAKLRVVERL